MKLLHALLILILTPSVFYAQNSVFGVKGGLAIGNQRYENSGTFDNGLLFRYHGDIYIENAPEDPTSVMYAQVGYHIRGHAQRFRKGTYQTSGGTLVDVPAFTQAFKFNNAAIGIGFKKRHVLNKEQAYYAIGVRGEYTLNTRFDNTNSGTVYDLYSLTKDFVKKFNFGMSFAGGYEFSFTELSGAFVEFSIHPDITKQYFQPAITNLGIRDPYGNIINSIPEQSIRNLSFELTLGLRFLRKVIYTD